MNIPKDLLDELRQCLVVRRISSGIERLNSCRGLLDAPHARQEYSAALVGYLAQWVDVGFGEDLNTTRNRQAAQNLAVVRKIALNILKSDKTSKASLKAKRKMAGWNHKFLLTLIANKNF